MNSKIISAVSTSNFMVAIDGGFSMKHFDRLNRGETSGELGRSSIKVLADSFIQDAEKFLTDDIVSLHLREERKTYDAYSCYSCNYVGMSYRF
jgi:hypothetical protein